VFFVINSLSDEDINDLQKNGNILKVLQSLATPQATCIKIKIRNANILPQRKGIANSP